MDANQPIDAPHLADYGQLLRRRWWIVTVGVLLGLTAGYLAMLVVPPTYTGSASVLVLSTDLPRQGDNATGGRTSNTINLDTEAQLVTSASVAEIAKALMHSDESVDSLADRVSVSVPPNSTVLTIAYDADTAEGAAKGAHAFAVAYLQGREDTAKALATSQRKALDQQVSGLERRLKRVTRRIGNLPPGSPDRQRLKAKQNVLTTQITSLNSELTPLESLQVDPGRIISDAAPPDSPSQPVPVLFLVSGLLLGLIAGLGAAMLRDRADHSVRTARDVTRLLDLPVLAELQLGNRLAAWQGLLPAASGAAQDVRQLQHAIIAGTAARQVLLVTAASTGPTARVVAVNLTMTLARSGKTVAHVCADPTSGGSAAVLGVRREPGLAEMLRGERTLDEAAQTAPASDLVTVLSPGSRAGAGGQLRTDDLDSVLARLRVRADYIVIEASPTTVNADAQAWAQWSDAAVVAVERLHTRREDVLDAVRQLERVGAEALGVVVLPPRPKTRARSSRPNAVTAVEPATVSPGP